MLKKEESKYVYETEGDIKVNANLVSGTSEKSSMSVKELRNFLNELVDAGYGDYSVEADTQDGDSYSVRNEVLTYDLSKVVKIF